MQRKEFDQQLFLSVSVGKLFPDIVPFNVQNFAQKIIRVLLSQTVLGFQANFEISHFNFCIMGNTESLKACK